MGLLSSCVHKVSQKRNLVNNRLYQRQTVRCQSNGNRASLVSNLPAPAAQTSAVGTACSRLPWPAVLQGRPHGPIIYSHPWSVYPSTHPHLLLFSGDGSRTSQPSYSPPRAQPLSCLPQLRVIPLPRPRRRPPPWCSRRGMVNVVNNIPSGEYCTCRG